LAALLTELSVAGANVLAVNHVRTDPRLGVSEVEVELQLETQGRRHRAELNEALRTAGYQVLG
jgi:threonine dehydratase